MNVKVGRFDAYVPDKDFFEILKEILSLSSVKSGVEIDLRPDKIQRFFYEMKLNHPSVFKDIYFGHDSDFPYSEDVAKTFTRMQESSFMSRPNPALNMYILKVNFKSPDSSRPGYKVLKKVASQFNKEFLVSNGANKQL